MKKNIIILLMIFSGTAYAQRNYFYLNWDYNIPLSNTDWLESASSSGGKLGYRAFIGDGKFSAGLDLNWTTYDQYEPTETFPQPGGAITTDYFKYIYNYGAVASGQYYFPVGETKRFFPYAGLGLGANYNEYVIYYNIYQDAYKAWGFLARPEAGILVRFGTRRSLGIMAAVHYDYSTNSLDEFDYSNFSSVGFQLGIMVMSW
jgi:hypothetical protein